MIYRPILHDKMAEMHALASLSESRRSTIRPIVQIRNPAKPDKALDSWSPVAALMGAIQDPNHGILGCWGTEVPIGVDLRLLRVREFDRLPVADLFDHCAQLGIKAVPVISRGMDPAVRQSVAQAARRLGHGVSIRLVDEELGVGSVGIKGLLSELDVSRDTIDLVLDMGNLPTSSTFVLGGLAASYLKKFNPISEWRSVSIAAASFPEKLSEHVGHNSYDLVPRAEQKLWNVVTQELIDAVQPDFSDYGIVCAGLPPGHRGAANLRFSTGSSWYVLRGENPDDAGSGDYLRLATLLRDSELWIGDDHCAGCSFTAEHIKSQRPGNSTQWREAGFAHHFEVVSEMTMDGAA
jgi:hypothetical protein